MATLKITLIHNFNEKRTSGSLQEIEKFKSNLLLATVSGTSCIGWQPERSLSSHWTIFRKEISTLKYLINWNFYLGWPGKARQVFYPLAISAARAWGFIKTPRAKRLRCFAEVELTRKHFRAWEAFLEDDVEWLMVVEDDIILSLDSSASVARLEKLLVAQKPSAPVYISVSNPYSVEQLKIINLVEECAPDYVRLQKPSSNTTAGYVINRKAAEIFATSFRRNPSLRYLSADLLLNSIFMKSYSQSKKFLSWHVTPEIFRNGTMSGVFTSSIS